MDDKQIQRLRGLINFPAIFAYLRDELGWAIETHDIDEKSLTYGYDPKDIAPQYHTKITRLRQLRPLEANQPFAIFYVEFENKSLPVVVLRRILARLTQNRDNPNLPQFDSDDLFFITVQGDIHSRSVAFAHFAKGKDNRVAQLRTFSWDVNETHFYYIRNLNLENLRWRRRSESDDQWVARWRDAFTSGHRQIITESKKLADEMADIAHDMRNAILEIYTHEEKGGVWHSLLERVRVDLISSVNTEQFADIIAQTITYGLFSAADQHPNLKLDDLLTAIPHTNPFLRDLLNTLVTDDQIDLIALGIDRLLSLYRDADMSAITKAFMRRTASGTEDPVILFYEDFLKAYDRQQRVERGVFYTPDPIVSYIVRSVDDILKREFGIADGLASADKNEGGEHRVQILDPATGTGTFLAHIIDRIADVKNPKSLSTADWNTYVIRDLLPRLNGFELMMAPYAVAHMKLALKLRHRGYDFSGGDDDRLRIFLTNALDAPKEGTSGQMALADNFFERESNSASLVKNQQPIMVVIGNPPYSGHSANQNDYINNLLRGSYSTVPSYYMVDGAPLGEKNPKWLQDDYVKFIRFGQERIAKTGYGVLAFITNHGYLDNPTFRGMRQSLMTTFDAIYIVNLHGNSRQREIAVDGTKDENVFDIMQGASIGIFVKGGKSKGVFYSDIWGTRNAKYHQLSTQQFVEDEFTRLEPQKSYYLFLPQDNLLNNEWHQMSKLPDIQPVNSVGIVTARDSLVIKSSPEEMLNTIYDFASLHPEQARNKYQLGADSRDWQVHLAQEDLQNSNLDKSLIQPIGYRLFDTRFTYYTGQSRGFICMPRPEVMQHMLHGNNLAMVTVRQQSQQGTWSLISVTNKIIEGCVISNKTREINYLFPLYVYPSFNRKQRSIFNQYGDYESREANLNPAFVAQFAEKLGLTFITDGRGDLLTTFGPEDIFHYAYAVFHSPTYRTRYAEFLKIDFPRLPMTNDLVLFNKLVQIGADLVALHLLDDDYGASSWVLDGETSPLVNTGVRFVAGDDGQTVGKFGYGNYDEKTRRVYLNSAKKPTGSYFEGIDRATWEFTIGGYQVLYKWLYDRRAVGGASAGRTLTDADIAHYGRVVASLRETAILMDEIDNIIEAHGGYPIVGSQEEAEVNNFPKSEKDLFGQRDNQYAFGDLDGETDMNDDDYGDDEEMGEVGDTPKLEAELTTKLLEESLAEYSGVEYEDTSDDDGGDIQPFDPTLINISTRSMSLDVILSRIKHEEINLRPEFQRMGGIWDRLKMSRLIESLMIRIPLPAFYMDATDENEWLVIDGLQRLTTLKRFIIPDNEGERLRLKGMEFWKEYEGKTYNDLPRNLQRRIEETQVTVYLVEKGTPHNVKFNIFRRINTGGVPLSGQEIRHALNLGKSTRLLKTLAESLEFKQATDNGVSPMRMVDRECVLRFLAFTIKDPSEYTRKDELDSFLNERMKEINEMSDAQIEAYSERFLRAMDASHAILGRNAFRKPLKSGRRSVVSKALFEIWSVNFDRLSDEHIQLLAKRHKLLERKFRKLMEDIEFDTAISYSTSNANRVHYRFNKIAEIIQEVINAG